MKYANDVPTNNVEKCVNYADMQMMSPLFVSTGFSNVLIEHGQSFTFSIQVFEGVYKLTKQWLVCLIFLYL